MKLKAVLTTQEAENPTIVSLQLLVYCTALRLSFQFYYMHFKCTKCFGIIFILWQLYEVSGSSNTENNHYIDYRWGFLHCIVIAFGKKKILFC